MQTGATVLNAAGNITRTIGSKIGTSRGLQDAKRQRALEKQERKKIKLQQKTREAIQKGIRREATDKNKTKKRLRRIQENQEKIEKDYRRKSIVKKEGTFSVKYEIGPKTLEIVKLLQQHNRYKGSKISIAGLKGNAELFYKIIKSPDLLQKYRTELAELVTSSDSSDDFISDLIDICLTYIDSGETNINGIVTSVQPTSSSNHDTERQSIEIEHEVKVMYQKTIIIRILKWGENIKLKPVAININVENKNVLQKET